MRIFSGYKPTTSKAQKRAQYEAILDTNHLQANLKARAIKGAGVTVLTSAANFVAQTLGTILLARLLSPEDFGVVAMVGIISLLIQNFGFNGFTEAIIQSKDLTHDQMSKLFWVNLFIMTALTLGFMALSPLLVWFYKEPQLYKITMALSSSILFGGLATCHFAILSRAMRFHLTSLIQSLAGVLGTIIAIITATQGIGYWALILRRTSGPLLTAGLAWFLCQWRPGLPKKNADIRPMLRFGLNTYGNFLMDYMRKNSDKIIIGRVFGKIPLGHYDRATQLSALLPSQLTASLSGVGIATLSRLRDDPKRFLDYYAKSLSILAFIGLPGSLLITLVGKDLIHVLLGPGWDIAGNVFTALGPAIGLVVIYDTNIWLHLSLGKPDRLLRWSIFMFIISLLAFMGGTVLGPIGIAIAYSVLFYLFLFPALYYAGKPMNIKLSYYLEVLWKYWVAAFFAGALFWIVFHITRPISSSYSQLSPIFRIAVCGLLYTTIYMGAIFVLFKGFQPLFLVIKTIKEVFRR